jgi:Amidohydrolase
MGREKTANPRHEVPVTCRKGVAKRMGAKTVEVRAGSADEWTAVDIAPYIDRALELFGPDRLMFGRSQQAPGY